MHREVDRPMPLMEQASQGGPDLRHDSRKQGAQEDQEDEESAHTPHFDALAAESLVMDPAYPESLPTLPTRRAIYTGRRIYPLILCR